MNTMMTDYDPDRARLAEQLASIGYDGIAARVLEGEELLAIQADMQELALQHTLAYRCLVDEINKRVA